MKNLPIYDKDGPIGSLKLSEEGLYIRFSACLPLRPGLWRLWLIGQGRAPLGIMEPGEEHMRLGRRLSKKELSKVKDPERSLLLPIDAEPPPEEKAACRGAHCASAKSDYPSVSFADSSPDKGSQEENAGESVPHRPYAETPIVGAGVPDRPKKPPEEKKEKQEWISRPDGSLCRRLENCWLIALPAAESFHHPACSSIYINGKKYTLLRY